MNSLNKVKNFLCFYSKININKNFNVKLKIKMKLEYRKKWIQGVRNKYALNTFIYFISESFKEPAFHDACVSVFVLLYFTSKELTFSTWKFLSVTLF